MVADEEEGVKEYLTNIPFAQKMGGAGEAGVEERGDRKVRKKEEPLPE